MTMQGSIVSKNTKKGKRYYIVIDLPVPPNSKRKQKWISAGTTKREAQNLLPKVLLKYQSYTNNDDLLFKDIATDYLYNAEYNLSKSTYKRYASCSKAICDVFGAYTVSKINPYMISQYLKSLQTKNYTPSTIQKYKTVLTQIFNYAIDLKIIDVSPIPKYKITNRSYQKEHQTWSTQELNDFLLYIKSQPLYIPVLLSGTTGIRCGEVVALKWKDVDFEKGVLYIVRSKTYDNTLKSTKNKSSRRSIHLMDHVVNELKAHQLQQKKNRIKYGKDYMKTDFICTLENGTPMSTNYISKTFPRKIKQYNFNSIRFHDLRHSFATIALSNGIHAKIVQEILGHSNIKITLDTYSHVIPTIHSESMLKLEKAFKS